MGQTSESQASLFFFSSFFSAMGVKTLSNCASFSSPYFLFSLMSGFLSLFFFPLSPPCQGKVQREERVIMLGMSAEDGL